MAKFGSYDDAYEDMIEIETGKIEQSRLPKSTQQVVELERELSQSRKVVADTLPTNVKRDQQALWQTALDEQQNRDSKRYGDKYQAIDTGKIPMGQDAWGKAGDQAAARDKAFAARMDELSNEAVRFGRTDELGGKVVVAQMKAEHLQYKADVQGDIVSKEIIGRGGKVTPYAEELRADRDRYQQAADRQAARFEAAQDMHSRRPQHSQRQDAYKALAEYAKDTGRQRQGEFVEKYQTYKQAQFDWRVAEATGTRQDIAAARAKLDRARTEGIAAKAGLKTSEIAQLSRELRAHNNGEKLLTKPAEKVAQAALAQPQGFRAFQPNPAVAESRANIAAVKAKGGQEQKQELGSGIRSRREELDERHLTLAKAGMQDDRAIRSIASKGESYRAAMSDLEDGKSGAEIEQKHKANPDVAESRANMQALRQKQAEDQERESQGGGMRQ